MKIYNRKKENRFQNNDDITVQREDGKEYELKGQYY